jgi:hypothetical protein
MTILTSSRHNFDSAALLPSAVHEAEPRGEPALRAEHERVRIDAPLPRLQSLSQAMAATMREQSWQAEPLLGADAADAVPAAPRGVLNPSDHADIVGTVRDATLDDVETALACATEAAPGWAATAPAERAARLEAAADRLEALSARGDVLLCAHGWFNRMLRGILRRRGWACIYDGGDRYWSWRRFQPRKQGRRT